MQFSFHGKTHSFSFLKGVGVLIATGFCVGMVLFIHRIYLNYVEIRREGADPVWQRQLKASVTRSRANPQVTAQDIARVASVNAAQFGNASASLAIVEFLDFDCPYCESSFAPVRELAEKYKNSLSLTVRDFPVAELHPRAFPAALAARCAKEQGKFWVYHDKLFGDQDHHDDMDFLRIAGEVGMDTQAFKTCYQTQRYAEDVNRDLADGLRAGVQGTPTFFFNGLRVQGEMDRETLETIIKQFLNNTTSTRS